MFGIISTVFMATPETLPNNDRAQDIDRLLSQIAGAVHKHIHPSELKPIFDRLIPELLLLLPNEVPGLDPRIAGQENHPLINESWIYFRRTNSLQPNQDSVWTLRDVNNFARDLHDPKYPRTTYYFLPLESRRK